MTAVIVASSERRRRRRLSLFIYIRRFCWCAGAAIHLMPLICDEYVNISKQIAESVFVINWIKNLILICVSCNYTVRAIGFVCMYIVVLPY